jgi:asparagine synthase (glutamine-hydrolysing)
LTKAVKLRLISDVPLGAFLSGGIDSSIMVALMSEMSNASVKTFSIGLENERESELPFAREVAQRYGTDHHELIARPDALDLLDQILWHFDEPFGDSSAIPTFLVSQLTKNYVTVAISGDGGDELFGGYERYRRILGRSNIQNIPKILRIPVSKLLGNILSYGFKGKAFLQSLQYDNYEFFTVGTSEELKGYLFSFDFLQKTKNITSYEVADKFLLKDQTLLNQCMYFDMKVYLPDDILTKVDRMSMANSLETRAPFLDHNLVEFAMTISPELKVNRGITKYILKKAFKDFLPENVYTHKKTGFSIPIGDWFKHELKSLVMETLSKGQIEQCGILSHTSIESMVSQHMSGYRSHDRLIWLTLMFQLWYDKWFNRTHPKIESALINRGIDNL